MIIRPNFTVSVCNKSPFLRHSEDYLTAKTINFAVERVSQIILIKLPSVLARLVRVGIGMESLKITG